MEACSVCGITGTCPWETYRRVYLKKRHLSNLLFQCCECEDHRLRAIFVLLQPITEPCCPKWKTLSSRFSCFTETFSSLNLSCTTHEQQRSKWKIWAHSGTMAMNQKLTAANTRALFKEVKSVLFCSCFHSYVGVKQQPLSHLWLWVQLCALLRAAC